jgi:hypothetical protein
MVESSQFFLAFRHALEVLQVCYRVILKGLALAMDLAFDDRCSNDFYNAKSVFIAVNASLCWLNNVSCLFLSFPLIASGA